MTEELTEDKNAEKLNEAKGKNEDFEMTEWHAKGAFVYDLCNNTVCECYRLMWADQDRSMAWAKHNARTIAFLHNDRLARDKIISQTNK